MANPRALDKRRKSIRNIRKITRTMELIATARFKKAMDRATAATAYARHMTNIVAGLAQAGLEVSHPLLEGREETKTAALLVITSNRGLCGGYNSSVLRQFMGRYGELKEQVPGLLIDVSGKRGLSAMRYRKIDVRHTYTQFEDRPRFEDVEEIATGYLDSYLLGDLDRLDVAYTKFLSSSKQAAVVETLLPLGSLTEATEGEQKKKDEDAAAELQYEFLPSAESILKEIVPTSFKVRLFKCFLDAAVSEQLARMVAMKMATDNASDIIKRLSMMYNRARQARITREIMEVIGGSEALNE
ncbi:MAG: ATP synthase F1 subunit gamma [Planctomycetes bacterium]|nr:ATP synthase F1 subunit gamma [Planctomycetota bacterium]MBL7041109.1 ATP synthase F1 subunit gamma [Pirellulaceae bacterium]